MTCINIEKYWKQLRSWAGGLGGRNMDWCTCNRGFDSRLESPSFNLFLQNIFLKITLVLRGKNRITFCGYGPVKIPTALKPHSYCSMGFSTFSIRPPNAPQYSFCLVWLSDLLAIPVATQFIPLHSYHTERISYGIECSHRVSKIT